MAEIEVAISQLAAIVDVFPEPPNIEDVSMPQAIQLFKILNKLIPRLTGWGNLMESIGEMLSNLEEIE
jgi:hypothetical protein